MPLEKVNIKRSGTEIEAPFVPVAVQRGDNKGDEYLGIDPKAEATADSISTLVNWLSPKTAYKVLTRFINVRSSGLKDEACEVVGKDPKTGEDILGEVDVAAYHNLLAEFSARGESKSELEEELRGMVDELTKLNPATDMPRIAELMKDIAGTNSTIQLKKRERKAKPAEATPAQAAA